MFIHGLLPYVGIGLVTVTLHLYTLPIPCLALLLCLIAIRSDLLGRRPNLVKLSLAWNSSSFLFAMNTFFSYSFIRSKSLCSLAVMFLKTAWVSLMKRLFSGLNIIAESKKVIGIFQCANHHCTQIVYYHNTLSTPVRSYLCGSITKVLCKACKHVSAQLWFLSSLILVRIGFIDWNTLAAKDF